MMRHAKKTDANHAHIRDGLRAIGWVVYDLSAAGGGIPDLAVSVAPGVPHFLEIKDGAKPLSAQALTEAQERWHSLAWRVTSKVRSLDEAVAAVKLAREKPAATLDADSDPVEGPDYRHPVKTRDEMEHPG